MKNKKVHDVPMALQAMKASNGYFATQPTNREQRRDAKRAMRKKGKK